LADRVFCAKKRTALRGISAALLAAFVAQDLALAEILAPPVDPARDAFSRALAQNVLPRLPESIARVEETFFPPESSTTLILIQDAHTNRTGQLNVARTLDFLISERAVRTVFLEAGDGNESLSFLRKYASPADRKRIAESYLRKGELQGTEYLDLTSDRSFVLWGVEDMSLYARSLETYRAAQGARGRAEDYLARAESAVRTLEPRVYNPFLYEFDRKYRAFSAGRAPITEYMQALSGEAEKLRIPLSSYPHLKNFNKLRELEAAIDFEKANDEQMRAVAESGAAEELAEASRDAQSPYKLGSAADGAKRSFYLVLEARLGKALSRYPELARYLEYLRYASELDAPALLQEQERLQSAVFTTLCESRDEVLLLEVSRNIDTLRKLLKLTLLPDEYREYRRRRRAHGLARMTGFLNRKLMESGGSYEKALFLETAHERTIRSCERFYFLTLLRDARFVENALAKMEKSGDRTAVLVAGGYHAPNLKRLLRRRNVSYACVTPNVLAETNVERYEKLLLGQRFGGFFARRRETPGPKRSTMMLTRTLTYDPWGTRETLGREIAGDAWPAALKEFQTARDREAPQAIAGARLARFNGFRHLLHLVVRKKIEDLQEGDTPPTDPRLNELFAVDRMLVEQYEKDLRSRLDSHDAVRVLQFNQMGNPTRERLEEMTRATAGVTPLAPPTIVTLQETSQRVGQYNTVVELANAMGYKHQEFLYRDNPKEGFQEGMAIVYHPSFEQEAMHHQLLPGRGGVEVLVLGVTLRSKVTGKRVHVFTTRLSWQLDARQERAEQLSKMRVFVQRSVPAGEPVIFSGDFNYALEEEAADAAERLGDQTDAFRRLNDGVAGVTTSRVMRTIKFPGKRPDVVYSRGLEPVHSRTVLNQTPVSDHFGVIADLDWSGDPAPASGDPNSVVDFSSEADRTKLVRRFMAALQAGEVTEELFGRAMAALAASDPDLAAHCLELVRSLSGHAEVLKHFQMSRDGGTLILPEDREEKAKFILRLLEPDRFQTMNERVQAELLAVADGFVFSPEEFDRYEDLLAANLRRSDREDIRGALRKYAQAYVDKLSQVPDDTLVVIQAGGVSSRLSTDRYRDKNTEPFGGLSQLRRHLNVLAALGYKNVAVVHNDKNAEAIRADVAEGRYPDSFKVDYVDGTGKGWFENFAGTVRSAQGAYKNVVMLIGESPVSIDNVARLRFSDQKNHFVFYPAPGSFHKAQITPKGRFLSYGSQESRGNLALVSLAAPVDDLLAHWNDEAGEQRPERSIETYLDSVHRDPRTSGVLLDEPADNINTPQDAEALRERLFHSVEALGKIKGHQSVHPRRLARASLILAGHYYGDSDLHPQSQVPVFSHHSTVWGTKDGRFYVKAQLPTRSGPNLFGDENYKRELWFYGTPLPGVPKPELVWSNDPLGVIVSGNAGSGDSWNLSEIIIAHDLLSARIVNPNREAMMLRRVGNMIRLMYNLHKSDKNIDTFDFTADMAEASLEARELLKLNYNTGSWVATLRVIARYYEGRTIPLVLTHGDYGPGNIIVSDQGQAVVDGEYAGALAPRERDLATVIMRSIQISSNDSNLRKIVREILDRHVELTGQKVERPILYYFIARKFLDSAYDIVQFRNNELGGRRDVEASRQFLIAAMASLPARDERPDRDPSKDPEQISEVIFAAAVRAQLHTRLLDHLRWGRISVNTGYFDPEGKPNAIAYYRDGDFITRGLVSQALTTLQGDREQKVAENAQRAFRVIDQNFSDTAAGGARLAEADVAPEGLLGLRAASVEDGARFARGLYDATKRTGFFALDASLFETELDRSRGLVVYGRDGGRLELALPAAAAPAAASLAAALPAAEAPMTMSDVKMKLDQARKTADAFQTDPALDAVKAAAVVDLDSLNPAERGFDEAIAPILAREMRAAREGTPWGRNARFLLAGDARAAARVMEELSKLYPKGQDFVVTDPAALGEHGERTVRVTTPAGTRQTGRRHFYLETPGKGDVPDFRGSFKAALSIARLETLDATILVSGA